MSVIIIVTVIGILFFSGLTSLLMILVNFKNELKNLDILESELKKAVNANHLMNNLGTNNLIPTDSSVYERVEITFNAIKNRIPINLSEFSELTNSKKEGNLKTQFSDFVLSTLLIIGLGGTFLAFREILGNSGIDTAQAENVNSIIKEIYGGFNSAFWASITGVFGTVILLFVKFVIVNAKQETFHNKLDFITQAKLIPLFSSLHKHSEVILSEISNKLEKLINSLYPTAEKLEDSAIVANKTVNNLSEFSDELKLATEKFSEFTSIKSPFIVAIGKLFDAISRSESRYSEYKDSFIKLTDQIQTQNELMAQTQTKFVELHKLFEVIHGQLSLDFKEINTNYKLEIKEIGKVFSNEIKLIIQKIEELFANTKNLIDIVNKKQIDQTDNLERAVETFNSSINSVKLSTDNILLQLNGLKQLEIINHALQEFVKNSDFNRLKTVGISVNNIENLIKNLQNSLNKDQLMRSDISNIQNLLVSIDENLKNKRFSVFGG